LLIEPTMVIGLKETIDLHRKLWEIWEKNYQISDGSDSDSAAQRRILKIDNVETVFARRSNKSKTFIINIIETRFIRH
jgi:hypothetical protein